MTTVQPTTRYVTVDGSRIAYQDFGSGAITLVASSGSFSHTDVVWEDPAGALFYSRLGSFARVIRYDRLGTSNSDPLPASWEPTQEAYERELGAVLDAVGVDHVALLAVLDAGPYAIQYAATHPDRVDRLILYNTTARFLADDDYEIGLPRGTVDAVFEQVTTLWGTEGQVAISAPSRAGDARFEAWYAKFLRSIGTPRAIAELIRHAMRLDARAALPQVAVPTLVMHRIGYPIVPASHGRYLADHIAGAEYAEIPGVDGPMFWEEPDLLMRLIREFVAEEAHERSAQIATILITDIVRSTERAEALGNREWSATVAVHLDVIHDAVTAYAGTVVKSTGDGAIATFADPTDAVSAATRLRARLDDMGITVRVGLHTGRIEVASDDIHGLAVHIAARVMAAAGDGDIVASRTVRDLLLGSSHRFNDLGRHALKGVEGEWELYRLDEGAH